MDNAQLSQLIESLRNDAAFEETLQKLGLDAQTAAAALQSADGRKLLRGQFTLLRAQLRARMACHALEALRRVAAISNKTEAEDPPKPEVALRAALSLLTLALPKPARRPRAAATAAADAAAATPIAPAPPLSPDEVARFDLMLNALKAAPASPA